MRRFDDDWKLIYRLGTGVALFAVAALLFDIVLAMMPGWEPSTTPATAREWFAQFSANPWLGLRNLDLLNVTVSVVTLPLYLALVGAHRRSRVALAGLAMVFVTLGTALFAASNAALPMLGLSRQWAAASGAADRAALESAAYALLARGAHGSLGAFAGFFLSEVGTLLMALAMLRGRAFGRRTALLGVVGASALAVYSVLMTFAPGAERVVLALAAPGGLLMIAWYVLVARRLWTLAAEDERQSASAPAVQAQRVEAQGTPAALLPR